ncbi:class I SAM-dependent methyltransferase [Zobellella sp. DQSA1]|uniref:class I SAM-dependent methyltransferase n=1 Tax=Zobellella sp. DQSA1 TaxID=3342386 RepID=UPI0035C11099
MSSLDNQAPQARPSSSARRVATARAVHQLLDEPSVLADPFALPILEPSLRRCVIDDPFQFNDPAARSMRAAVVGRSRLAEDTFTEALAEGVRQLVILGAGLDTFTLRAAADHPCVPPRITPAY